jgi:hypothetical protein
MTLGQQCLFLLAHVLLACALLGAHGDMPQLLASGCVLASLLGLARAVGELSRGRP